MGISSSGGSAEEEYDSDTKGITTWVLPLVPVREGKRREGRRIEDGRVLKRGSVVGVGCERGCIERRGEGKRGHDGDNYLGVALGACGRRLEGVGESERG